MDAPLELDFAADDFEVVEHDAFGCAAFVAAVEPARLVLDVPAGHDAIALAWYNDPLTPAYDTRVFADRDAGLRLPASYRIDLARAGGHEVAVDMPANWLHSRTHRLELGGDHARVGLAVTGAWNRPATFVLDLRDATALDSAWMLYGDSITCAALSHDPLGDAQFSDLVEHACGVRPMQECGAVNGMETSDLVQHLPGWIASCAARWCAVAIGTNDANRADPNDRSVVPRARDNIATCVDRLLATGHQVVMPTIPWGTTPGVAAHGPGINDAIRAIVETRLDRGAHHGPDLWTLFEAQPELMADDGFHPTLDGYRQLRRWWAEWAVAHAYT